MGSSTVTYLCHAPTRDRRTWSLKSVSSPMVRLLQQVLTLETAPDAKRIRARSLDSDQVEQRLDRRLDRRQGYSERPLRFGALACAEKTLELRLGTREQPPSSRARSRRAALEDRRELRRPPLEVSGRTLRAPVRRDGRIRQRRLQVRQARGSRRATAVSERRGRGARGRAARLDPDDEGGDISTAPIRGGGQQQLVAALLVDPVVGVADRALAPRTIRLLDEHDVRQLVVEEELGRELEPARRVGVGADLEVDV